MGVLRSVWSVVALLSLCLLGPERAEANWLTSLTKGAGRTASHLHPNLGAIERATVHLSTLPKTSGGGASLAAHATPEGHWQFANREGQLFTAGSPDEMRRVTAALLPDGVPDGKLSLYLSEESVFANREALAQLPAGAELHLVSAKGAFPLERQAGGALSVRLKPNVRIGLQDPRGFDDAIAFLTKPLNKSNIRTLAIEPGGAKSLSSAPKLNAASKTPLVDAIDPEHVARGFSSIRGQTALIVGRIEGETIVFQPAAGGEVSRRLDELVQGAHDFDVNLIVLHADTPRQPGGQNWLWQRVEIGGWSDAISKSTFADFIDAFAARRGPMQISASADGPGRVQFTALADADGGTVASVKDTLTDLVASVTAEVATKAISVHARDQARDAELDGRIIPGIPTYVQIPYFISIFAGLIAWSMTRSLWRRMWPPAPRGEDGFALYMAKTIPNFLVYLLMFLPIVGLPAFVVSSALSAWETITAPFRWLARKLRRRVEV